MATWVALDAMGGDFAPQATIEGALLALKEFSDLGIYLVGQPEALIPLLKRKKYKRLEIVPASQVVAMDESPIGALRSKHDSSIRKAFDLVKEGQAHALVSAGNSGAVLATALFVLGRVKGVSRPAIATVLPTMKGNAVMIDSGANVDCKPHHLLQFAHMGMVFCREILGVSLPKVGLLSIGEEGGKGNTLVKRAHQLLSQSRLNYVGNVEGRDIYRGDVDVIVCDGFVGNICLKLSEGLAEALMSMMAQEIQKYRLAQLGFSFAKKALRQFKTRIDWRERGGAPLLGVKGVVIISHGRSDARAIKNALGTALGFVKENVLENLAEALENLPTALAGEER
ncbi:MAG: phosphate acyltransferase PlsX [Thermodesulfobacteria bacterium]|nr:phosphate acyltransferase PlsX [Thermodesulfobacteriota bacterium]